mmetsp:Transcript_5361/g.10249  ORF Transcript_5361/g.10249 Transcript_5361/m.10249 type:complete len:494 (-) Transcript_5361:264-1745(-)
MDSKVAEECIRNADDVDGPTEEILLKLFDIGAIKFGNFTLKSGVQSPIYIDLRVIVSFPDLLKAIAEKMYKLVEARGVKFDVICGVPYTALPVATAMSMLHGKPMVMRRKEVKKYGTKRIIEGIFKQGQTCLVIEDLITSGMSVMETTGPLNDVGLKTTDVVVLVDREQGGATNLTNRGVTPHAVLKISQMCKCLVKHKRLTMEVVGKVATFLKENQVVIKPKAEEKIQKDDKKAKRALTYEARADKCKNKTAVKLLKIMAEKKTNLCFSADITDKKRLLEVVEAVGPHICMLKTHIDTLEDFDMDVAKKLRALADKYNFIIFEDRKYADIGNTVVLQYSKGIYRPVEWADIVNAHPLPGPGIVDGLKKNGGPAGRGLVLIAEMSSKGNLATGAYTDASIKMALDYPDYVMGFISMRKLTDAPGIIHMTPGVKLVKGGDGMGQQYNTPELVLAEKLSDLIIVGRGIYQATDPKAEAARYRQAGWDAYEKSLRQ